MEELDVPPQPQLLESMRAVGYSLRSAIADLIDNSITAGSDTVDVRFATAGTEYLFILDNGHGMDPIEAVDAMRLGTRSPLQDRDAGDLGRFGLGLKTASLAQCRELTIVTKKDDVVTALRWSLDHVLRTGRWSLLRLSDRDLGDLPGFGDLTSRPSGTLVLWRDLDRLGANAQQARAYDELMIETRDHLALVFHRFLAGQTGTRLTLTINGVGVPHIDPFLEGHRATQRGPVEPLVIAGNKVTVQAFTLPFINKLSTADRRRAQITGNLRDNQGFYVYRAHRLVIWGTWFGIVPKDDLGKLARVRVDVPNSMDHLWALDIKKSAASPPAEIRRELRRVADTMLGPSRRAHRYRGRPESDAATRMWKVIAERDGFRYEINREHPAVRVLTAELGRYTGTLESIFRLIETTYPLSDAFNRLAGDQAEQQPATLDADVQVLARQLWQAYIATHDQDVQTFAQTFRLVEPFVLQPDPAGLLRKAATS
jgi:hypothetical protein